MRLRILAPVALLAWLFGAAAAPRPAYDIVIRGGTIYDGSGASPYVGDVAISGDRIVAVGRVAGRGDDPRPRARRGRRRSRSGAARADARAGPPGDERRRARGRQRLDLRAWQFRRDRRAGRVGPRGRPLRRHVYQPYALGGRPPAA